VPKNLPPRDVCPRCDQRAVQEKVLGLRSENCLTAKYRCSACGDVHRYCDIKRYTAQEKVEAEESRREYQRQWYRENRDRVLADRREPAKRARKNALQRLRYRQDPEHRAKRLKACSERWHSEEGVREAHRAANRRYYERNCDKRAVYYKRHRLEMSRENGTDS
jgi:hypothetical protein